MVLPEGTQLGQFTLQSCLGQGATGTVYKAQNGSNQVLAVKVLSEKLSAQPSVVTMFDEEAKVGLQLNHPNIVRTLHIGCESGRHFIVFEYINGTSLGTLLSNGPLPEAQCVWIMRHLAQALRQLRQKSIVHQDIKPDNILLTTQGDAKLSDLGFARAPKGRIRWDGVAVGTPLYMSPEQARGLTNVDGRSDIYSLGATIYHAATGQPPFDAKTEEEMLQMHLSKRPPSARGINPKLNADFSAILARMLEKDPQWRFQHPEELLLSLRMLDIVPAPPVMELQVAGR